jgi:hypothetical protein
VTASNRLQMAQGLQTWLAGVTNPATGLPLYQAVQLGAFFNPALYSSWAEVAFFQGLSVPANAGWRIRDTPTFSIVSGWDYETDSTAAMTNMLEAQDILLPLLHSHVSIPTPGNQAVAVATVYSVLTEQPDRAIPVRIPNGHVYLLWHVYVICRQEYNVTLTVP